MDSRPIQAGDLVRTPADPRRYYAIVLGPGRKPGTWRVACSNGLDIDVDDDATEPCPMWTGPDADAAEPASFIELVRLLLAAERTRIRADPETPQEVANRDRRARKGDPPATAP